MSQDTARLMVFKLVMAASITTWRRLKGQNQLPKVVNGIKFKDGIETVAEINLLLDLRRHRLSRVAPVSRTVFVWRRYPAVDMDPVACKLESGLFRGSLSGWSSCRVVGWLVFDERVAPVFWLGVAFIVVGVALTQYGAWPVASSTRSESRELERVNDRDLWRPAGQLCRNPLGQLAAVKAGTVAYSGSYAVGRPPPTPPIPYLTSA